MRALVVGPVSLKGIARDNGYETAVRFPLPRRLRDQRALLYWIGEVEAVFTEAMFWMIVVPHAYCLARDPGRLQEVYLKAKPWDMKLLDTMMEDLRDHEESWKRFRSYYKKRLFVKRTGAQALTPELLMKKHAAIVKLLEEDPSRTAASIRAETGRAYSTVARVRKAWMDAKTSKPYDPL